MAKDLILKGLQQNAKSLEDSGRVRVATNFKCRIASFVRDRFHTYMVTEIDEATGRKVRRTILPDIDSDGNRVAPQGADDIPTILVVLYPIDSKGEEQEPVRGFVLENAVRGLPSDTNPVGMTAFATGVEAVRKNGEQAGELGYFISGLDISSENAMVLALAVAKAGGALFTR